MNTGKKDGCTLELELFNKLKNQLTNTKCEGDIKKEYFSFCSGVDIMCNQDNKSIYIQCKFSDKPTQINDVNHFILSAKCLQDNFIKTNEYKLVWVCKNKPSLVGQDSLKHYNVEIIENNDLTNLINNAEQYVLNYFSSSSIQSATEYNNHIYNYNKQLIEQYEQLKKNFKDQCIEQVICDWNIKDNMKLYLNNNDYKKLDKSYVDAFKNYTSLRPTILTGSSNMRIISQQMNWLIKQYNEIYKKQIPQVLDEDYYIMCVKAKHFNAFKPGSHKKIKNRDEFKQYLIDPEYRYYML
jgi:hypothetical protein